MQRAALAEQKEAARQAKLLHEEAMWSQAAAMNAELALQYEELDQLLSSTLEVDDYVDLDDLVQRPAHPPFDPGALGVASPNPGPPPYPPEPTFEEPPAPKGIGAALGGAQRHAANVDAARRGFEQQHAAWQQHCRQLDATYRDLWARWKAGEDERLQKLAAARATYEQGCRERESDVAAANADLAAFKSNLAFDVPEAIEEYVQIVLANSAYPEVLPVEHSATFDLGTRELSLSVVLPAPDQIPAVKEYRYVAAQDEVVPSTLPVKDQRARYSSIVQQVAVRTLHEIFEADRAEKIQSIAMEVVVKRISPATGLGEDVPLVRVAVDRSEFATFDLGKVDPAATLQHLGGEVSKNPHGLVPVNMAPGVRQRGAR
ncbi:hypothetical protein ACSDQ9_13325 [Aestuariimicrobium soli]|uniref:hypothetical protein n=1 Tax=Aestuariimicrobium soli TaxID=2035834 RepID=UPI003EBDC05B